jgi:sugar lactone lactonase YvrE
MKVDLVLDARAQIGESPIWVAEDNCLYWADIKAPALHRTQLDTTVTETWALPAELGAYALDGRGRALVALRTGLYWLDLATRALVLQTMAPFDSNIVRFNEGACDSRGRFWIGTMTDPVDGSEGDRRGSLYSFTSAQGLIAHPDFAFLANGMAWNLDETIFYLAHSYARKVFAFAYDKRTGTLGKRTEFIHMAGENGIPDGAAIDSEGGYWCAIHGGGRLHRYTPSGQLDRVVPMPVSQPTMCCFVGKKLDELYVSSAREKLQTEQLKQEPHAGGIFRLRPDIAGHRKYWRVE